MVVTARVAWGLAMTLTSTLSKKLLKESEQWRLRATLTLKRGLCSHRANYSKCRRKKQLRGSDLGSRQWWLNYSFKAETERVLSGSASNRMTDMGADCEDIWLD